MVWMSGAIRRHHLCLWSTLHILALYWCWQGRLNHSQKIVTKCDGIITNCDRLSSLQSAMDCYYKLRELFYYKVRQGLLQIATGVTKCVGFITNWQQQQQQQQYLYSPCT